MIVLLTVLAGAAVFGTASIIVGVYQSFRRVTIIERLPWAGLVVIGSITLASITVPITWLLLSFVGW